MIEKEKLRAQGASQREIEMADMRKEVEKLYK